ncbi:hypothetical protein ES703_125685 [subsurface metagenome]
MFGPSLPVQPGGIGCHKSKRIIFILVFYKVEKYPAHEMHIRAVSPDKIFNRSVIGFNREGEGIV